VYLTEGFDFLGFNIRHYPVPTTARSGYKVLIKPSKESVRKFKERMRLEWMDLKGHNTMEILKRLNPIVRRWASYFRIGVSKRTFETLDHWMFARCARHVRSKHPARGGAGAAPSTGVDSTPKGPTGGCSVRRAPEPAS
jgi:RNA-directed DNA polymerase